MEWYSSGLRGRFAKSLGWVTGAEVRILSTPPRRKMGLGFPRPFLLSKTVAKGTISSQCLLTGELIPVIFVKYSYDGVLVRVVFPQRYAFYSLYKSVNRERAFLQATVNCHRLQGKIEIDRNKDLRMVRKSFMTIDNTGVMLNRWSPYFLVCTTVHRKNREALFFYECRSKSESKFIRKAV